MSILLLAILLFGSCVTIVIVSIAMLNGEFSDYSLKSRIITVSLFTLVPISIGTWIKMAPFPIPIEKTYPITFDVNNNCNISNVDGIYVNVNSVTGQQVDTNKHLLKVSNPNGWSGGIYWHDKAYIYSLVNKNLEK